MKHLMIVFAVLGSLSLAHGQSKNDPTYSIHNYKHPNKAEEAKLTKKEGVVNDAYTPEKNVASRNYKAFNAEVAESGASMPAAPAEKSTNALASSRNYKSSFGKSSAAKGSNESDSYTTPVVKNKGGLPKGQ